MKTSVINQIKTLLGMDVKLEQRKMADGVTLIEADAFEMDNEVFVITEDEQKIPVPIGEYEMEDGMIMSVVEEGIIADYKEAKQPKKKKHPLQKKKLLKKKLKQKTKQPHQRKQSNQLLKKHSLLKWKN
jgi:hypothetical protein